MIRSIQCQLSFECFMSKLSASLHRSGKYDTQAQVLTYDVKLLPQTTPASNGIRFSPVLRLYGVPQTAFFTPLISLASINQSPPPSPPPIQLAFYSMTNTTQYVDVAAKLAKSKRWVIKGATPQQPRPQHPPSSPSATPQQPLSYPSAIPQLSLSWPLCSSHTTPPALTTYPPCLTYPQLTPNLPPNIHPHVLPCNASRRPPKHPHNPMHPAPPREKPSNALQPH